MTTDNTKPALDVREIEEEKENLRAQIRRCKTVIEKGAPDSWWAEDLSRFEHRLRLLEQPALPASVEAAVEGEVAERVDWKDAARRAAGAIDSLLLYCTYPGDSAPQDAMALLLRIRDALGDRRLPRMSGQIKPGGIDIPLSTYTPKPAALSTTGAQTAGVRGQIHVGDQVRVVEIGHEQHGQQGQVIYLPDEDGEWYEVRLSDGSVAVVTRSAGLAALQTPPAGEGEGNG